MSALALNHPRGCHTFEKQKKTKKKNKTNANNQTKSNNPLSNESLQTSCKRKLWLTKIISLQKGKQLSFLLKTEDSHSTKNFIIYSYQYYNFSHSFCYDINFNELKYIIDQLSPTMLCHDNHSTILQYIRNFTVITIYYTRSLFIGS